MSNNKQSSVEFLTMQLIKNGIITNDDLQQAKAMHKEEHFNTWWHGISENEPISFEEYYNETFGE